MRAVGTGSTGSRLTRERSGSVIRGHTKRSPRSVGEQETRTHDDDSSRIQWVSGVLADESEKKTNRIIRYDILGRGTFCGLSATHSSAVLFHNVGFSHSKAVTNYAAETGVEPLLVPAYAPCVGQVRGVFVVIKCHVCVHGSMHEHFASRTPVFRKSCFDQW
jgi:hypothetical protein